MKNIYLLGLALLFMVNCFAQDSITLGAGYKNDVYFSLKNGIVQTEPAKNWDIAFGIYDFDAAALINSENGVTLYNVQNVDTSAWSTLDTSGLSTWPVLYNSDTAWNFGAFNEGENILAFNYGWGVYDINTNQVIGDSLFVMRLVDSTGAVQWKKFWLVKRATSGTYFIRYANLDNSDLVNDSIPALNYANKLFIYYSIRNRQIVDREPDKNSWDLLFTKYYTFIPFPPPGIFYPVTGVLSNNYSGFDPATFTNKQIGNGVQVSQVGGVDQPAAEFDPKADFFSNDISEIGYDWKTFDMNTNTYTVSDTTVYFVRDLDSMIYKLYFTGYDLVNSTFFFNFGKATISGIGGINNVVRSMGVFPNPAKDQFTIAYDLQQNISSARLEILDASGAEVYETTVDLKKGFNEQSIQLPKLSNGVYSVRIVGGNGSAVAQLVVAQ